MTFRRVVKLGGSLLDRQDLQTHLPLWVRKANAVRKMATENLIVVGGGKLVDAIRESDRIEPGNPAEIHWKCVDLMDSTHQMVRQMFPDWHVISFADEFGHGIANGFPTDTPVLVAAMSFYHRDVECSLPNDWRTTSDAIAAYLATQVSADELVLLKSCDVDPSATVDELAAIGIVDETLPLFAPSVRRILVQRLQKTLSDQR